MVAAAPSFVPPQQAAAPVEAPRQAVAQAQVQRLPVVEPIRAVSIIERLPQVAVMPVAAVPVGTIPLGTAPVAVAPSNEARPATPPIEQVAVAPTPTPVMHVVERIAAPPAVEVAPAPAATLPKAVPLASEVAVAAQPATPRAEKTEMPDTVVKGMGRQTGVARTAQPAYGVRNVATVDVSPAPTVNMPKVIQTQTRTAAPTSIVANKPTSSTVAKTTPPSHGIRNLTATDAWQTATASDKSAVSQPVEVRQAMTTRPAATYGRAPAVHGSTYR
jgi:ribonuclease E